ncbi:hypothetical protein PENSPDRAFT_595854, partial [Peniophora sp. CONT]
MDIDPVQPSVKRGQEGRDPLGWGEGDETRAHERGKKGVDVDLFDEEDAEAEDELDRIEERLQELEIDRGVIDDGLGLEDEGAEGDGPGAGDGGGPGAGDGGGPGGDPGGGAGPRNAPDKIVPHPPPPQGKRSTVHFGGRAGEALNAGEPLTNNFTKYESDLSNARDPANEYHPFESKMDWDIGAWAKSHGISANALTDLLAIEGLADALRLQFRTSHQLDAIMDKELPPRPDFVRRTYTAGGEKHELYMRDSRQVLEELYGRPDFANDMIYTPEMQYVLVGEGEEDRVRSDMQTSSWWWQMQTRLEGIKPGATIVPLIVSSDKTQLTTFRNRSAYPVYLTIGNIPKELRRKTSLQAHILLGYLPVSNLASIKRDDLRRRALASLFHECMRDILAPLRDVAKDGFVMTSGDGVKRRCHLLLAAYVGDYPEQVLVTGIKSGLCPKGWLDSKQFGTQNACERRNHDDAAAALLSREDHPGNPRPYLDACAAEGVKPINAFWKDYPHADIFQSITPDILHQQYQGVVKHLVAWLKVVYGERALDERFKCLPANHQLRLFHKGISKLSRVTGTEHQDICRVLLAVIADIPLPNADDRAQVLKATRALLDFVYLSQYPEASTATLKQLDDALTRFHNSKDIFIKLGARDQFNLPKLHVLAHYVDSIKLFGTPDNFNTSYSERLHIDYTKMAYRSTNRKDEYPQMTLWLIRREQIRAHRTHIKWRLQNRPSLKSMPRAPLPGAPKLKKPIATNASEEYVSFAKAERLYGAENFERTFSETITKAKYPALTNNQVKTIAATLALPFHSVSAFHRLKFWHADALDREGELVQELPDSVKARPAYRDTQRRRAEGTFSTALVDERGKGDKKDFRIGQVRIIFSLTDTSRDALFGDRAAEMPTHYAYIQWFTRLPAHADRYHNLHRVQRSI